MRRRSVLTVILAPLAAALVLDGCGYSLRTSMPPGITSIHVPVLENKTAEPGIEDFITQALTQAVVNGLIGILAFQIVEAGPGLLQRRRSRGATLSRRHY